MSNLRFKLALTRDALATLPHGIEARLEKAFGRHLFGHSFFAPADRELREEIDLLIRRLIKNRQTNSTYRSRVRASSIARDLCNLASRFPIPRD